MPLPTPSRCGLDIPTKRQLGRIDEALIEAEKALELAPDNEREALSNFIAELRQAQGS